MIGFYMALYGILLIVDPWTYLNYDRSVREIGTKNNNTFVSTLLNLRYLYGVGHISSGYCIMNGYVFFFKRRITSMKVFITSLYLLDITL